MLLVRTHSRDVLPIPSNYEQFPGVFVNNLDGNRGGAGDGAEPRAETGRPPGRKQAVPRHALPREAVRHRPHSSAGTNQATHDMICSA